MDWGLVSLPLLRNIVPEITSACENNVPRGRDLGICHCIKRASCILDPFLPSLKMKYWDELIREMFKRASSSFLSTINNIHIRTLFSPENKRAGRHRMHHRLHASPAPSHIAIRHKQRLSSPITKRYCDSSIGEQAGFKMDYKLHRAVHPIPHPNHGGAPKPTAGIQQGPSPIAPLLAHSKDLNYIEH